MSITDNAFYVTGGTLRYDSPSYVERQADKDLRDGLLHGEFCHILTSRQMGKSSLMARTANWLQAGGTQVVALDLTAIGQNLTPEQWYDGLIAHLGRQLRLEDKLEPFWVEHERLGPIQRWFAAIRDVALPKRPGPLVIFVDEIDAVRSLPFSTDEFFAAIRECYNRRAADPEFRRLTFCLLGVATPSDLIRDLRITPFNVGRRIELTDFTPAEAAPLAAGLRLAGSPSPATDDAALAKWLLERILYWTNGHPYLTQRLCEAVSLTLRNKPAATVEMRSSGRDIQAGLVDQLCEDLFLSNRARERDDNLLFASSRMLRNNADLIGLLTLYHRVRSGQTVRDEETNPLIDQLRLAGITKVSNGFLQVRNRIYYRVFDNHWIATHLPSKNSDAKSIAVLPFANFSPEPENEYLSDGITEDLITALSQVKGLWVAARTSSFAFKDRREDVRKVGEMLGVTLVLEGSVQKAQNRIRITAQLINATDGFHVWSEKFDRDLKDVFAVQDEISRAIVEALKIRLATETATPLIRRQTSNTEAYQYYLRGRFFWNRRGDSLWKGLRFFELALLEDEHYALAYTGVADSYNLLAFYDYLPPKEAIPKAKAAAHRALELDEGLAEAHNSLGFARLIYDWDWCEAEKEFKRALELNPNHVPAIYWYANFCSALGQLEQSIAIHERGVELDPLSSLVRAQFAWLLLVARQYGRAEEELRKALDAQPNFFIAHWILGQVHAAQSRCDAAIRELEKAADLSGQSIWMRAMLGYVYGRAGRRQEALAILQELEQRAQSGYVRQSLFSALYVGLGDPEKAIDYLEKGYADRDFEMVWLQAEPIYDPLRSDPRFIALLKKVGLAK